MLVRRILAAFLFLAGLAVFIECYARVGLWYWSDEARPLKPLSRRVLRPAPEFVPGVAPRARFLADQRGLRVSAADWEAPPELLVMGSSTSECSYLDTGDSLAAQISAALAESAGRTVVARTAAKSGLLAWHCTQYCRDLLPLLPGVRVVVLMPGATDMNSWLRGGRPTPSREMRNALYTWPWAVARGPRAIASADRLLGLARGQARSLLDSLHVNLGQSEAMVDDTGASYRDWRAYRAAGEKVGLPERLRAALPEWLVAYRRNLADAAEGCARSNVELVLATQPLLYAEDMTAAARALWWSGGLGPTSPSTRQYLSEAAYADCLAQFNDATRDVAARLGVPLVDLAAEMPDPDGRYFYDTLHFHSAGARRAGRLIAEKIAGAVDLRSPRGDLRRERVEYASSADAALRPLLGDVYYRASWAGQRRPMLVLMHGFREEARSVAGAAAFARARGFVALAPEMRGRGGSAGAPDYGGLEIRDVVDMVDAVAQRYGDLVNPDDVSIEGFSGGGGNVLSAITKFPQRWRAALCWFGISDYGHDLQNGWYHQTTPERRELLRQRVGDPQTPRGQAAYAARASVLAAANCRTPAVALFVERDETICPPSQMRKFEEAARAAGVAGVRLHVGESGEYRHGVPDWLALERAHRLVWPSVAEGAADRSPTAAPTQPVGGMEDCEWIVCGYLETRELRCVLGDGADSLGRLRVQRDGGVVSISLRFETAPGPWSLALRCDEAREVLGAGASPLRIAPREGWITLPKLHADADLVLRPAGTNE